MKKVKLIITYPDNLSGSRAFNDKEAAQHFLADLYWFNSAVTARIEVDIPKLNGWYPDDADLLIMRTLLNRGDKVTPIKFARIKSVNGLKEAKDWIDQYFADDYKPAPTKY